MRRAPHLDVMSGGEECASSFLFSVPAFYAGYCNMVWDIDQTAVLFYQFQVLILTALIFRDGISGVFRLLPSGALSRSRLFSPGCGSVFFSLLIRFLSVFHPGISLEQVFAPVLLALHDKTFPCLLYPEGCTGQDPVHPVIDSVPFAYLQAADCLFPLPLRLPCGQLPWGSGNLPVLGHQLLPVFRRESVVCFFSPRVPSAFGTATVAFFRFTATVFPSPFRYFRFSRRRVHARSCLRNCMMWTGCVPEHRYLHFGWVQGGRGNAPGIDIVVLRKPKPLPDFFCLPAVGVMDLHAWDLLQLFNKVWHDLVDDAQEAVLFIQAFLPLFQLLKHGMVFYGPGHGVPRRAPRCSPLRPCRPVTPG